MTWAQLIDVSEIPMTEIITSTDTVLGRCLERLVNSLDDPDGVISAFQSIME